MDDIKAIHAPLRRRYTEEPSAARYTYRVRVADDACADLWHSVARSLGHPGPDYLASPNEKVGGPGEPTPGDLLLGALATCKALSTKMVAAALGVELLALEVEVWGDVDHRGVLMMPGGARPGFESIRCVVRVAVADHADVVTVQKLQLASEMCCAVTDTLRNPTPLETQFEVRRQAR